MRRCAVLAAALLVALCSCSDDQSGAESAVALADEQELSQRHHQITEEGVLADFVSAISTDSYERAFGMLHPELSQVWTQERFTQDWKEIKGQISENWKPEPTGSFSGQSPQGTYEQATYRLESHWRSMSSVDLTAMRVNGQPKIVNVQIRLWGIGEPSAEVQRRTQEFVESMIAQEFESVSEMFAPACRGQYPHQVLRQVSLILGSSVEATSRQHYRICASGRWYDGVRLTAKDDAVIFVELVMYTDGGSVQIEGLSFKGRIRM